MKRLAIYDFDGTLFKSPEKPPEWTAGWWGNPASLSAPIVPERPGAEWWNPHVVEAAQRDSADPATVSLLLTGRLAKRFTARLTELLAQAELSFDRVILSPGGDTEAHKLLVIGEFLEVYRSIEEVDIWEDRHEHLVKFTNFACERGKFVRPHLV